jgi:hypothetical protein
VRYRLKVWNSMGDQIANWPLAAYGKSEATVLGGSDALQRAAVLAMRDAAALMIDKMDRETGIGSTQRRRPPALDRSPATAADPATNLGNNLIEVSRNDAG